MKYNSRKNTYSYTYMKTYVLLASVKLYHFVHFLNYLIRKIVNQKISNLCFGNRKLNSPCLALTVNSNALEI